MNPINSPSPDELRISIQHAVDCLVKEVVVSYEIQDDGAYLLIKAETTSKDKSVLSTALEAVKEFMTKSKNRWSSSGEWMGVAILDGIVVDSVGDRW